MTVKYMQKCWIENIVHWTDEKYSCRPISEFPNAVKIGRGKFDKDDYSVWKIGDDRVVTSRFSQDCILTCFA